jgi:hypothetical protein
MARNGTSQLFVKNTTPAAADILDLIARLPPGELANVRRALCPWIAAGSASRRAWADRRWELVHRLITAGNLPTRGHRAWHRILGRLFDVDPVLTLTRILQRGACYHDLAPFWIHCHTIKPDGLRRGYFAWQKRRTAIPPGRNFP